MAIGLHGHGCRRGALLGGGDAAAIREVGGMLERDETDVDLCRARQECNRMQQRDLLWRSQSTRGLGRGWRFGQI